MIGAFSFYGNKTISTGEGGMVVTNSDDLARKVRLLRGQGQTERYFHVEVGYNYRMTNVQAAIGLAQIERISEIMAEKERVFERYLGHLGHLMAKTTPSSSHSKWAVAIKTPSRDKLVQALAHEGVETRPVFVPLPCLPPYLEPQVQERYPNATSLGKEGLVLPSYPELSNSEIDLICGAILRKNA
jgi:perosamine synthetase